MNRSRKHFASAIAVYILIIMTFFHILPVSAENGQGDISRPEKVFPLLNREAIRKRIVVIEKKSRQAETAGTPETAKQLGVPLTSLQEQGATLRKLVALYKQQLTALERKKSLQREEESLGGLLETRQEDLIAQPPPYNLSFYDGLLGELTTSDLQRHTLEIALRTEKKVFEELKVKAEQAGQPVRKAKEIIQAKNGVDQSPKLIWNIESALNREELSIAYLDLQRLVVDNLQTEVKIAVSREQLARRHVAWARSRLRYDQEDLDKVLISLEKRKDRLQQDGKALQAGRQKIENDWLLARKQLEEAMDDDERAKGRAAAFLAAREAWRTTYQKVLEQTETVLLFLEQEKQFWRYRYSLLKSKVSSHDMDSWEEQVSGNLHSIERHIELSEQYHTDLQSEIASLEKQLSFEDLADDRKEHLETQRQALRRMAERGFEYLSLLQGTRSVGKRLIDEISANQKDAGIITRIRAELQKAGTIWEAELWVVDERSVTVHKLFVALLIFAAGLVFIRLFTRLLIRRILGKMQLDRSATIAIEKMLFSAVLVLLLITALHLVNIPLAVFTFLGGGLALSLGFGARNLLNNFISGFILMIERPVKINDMIEVDNNFGIIENIGMRCTRVRTSGNIHILVPNSVFLESNIVNWTLSDQEIRAKVVIRVSLDADPGEVERVVLQAARENNKVLHSPKPIILFDEMPVGLQHFTLYFWVSMKNLQLLERRIVESEVRFSIIALLREAGITLARQERIVHLHASRSMDLQLNSTN